MHVYRVELDEEEVEAALGLEMPTVFYVKADVFDETGDVALFKVQPLGGFSDDEILTRLEHALKAEVRQQHIRRFYKQ